MKISSVRLIDNGLGRLIGNVISLSDRRCCRCRRGFEQADPSYYMHACLEVIAGGAGPIYADGQAGPISWEEVRVNKPGSTEI